MKKIVVDLDETICTTREQGYENALPKRDVIERLREYKNAGFDIVISTSRNVQTFEGNVGKINAFTLPIIINWLKAHEVPFDEIYTGKPWCGTDGFYVDDRAIRPDEFVQLSLNQILMLTMRKEE